MSILAVLIPLSVVLLILAVALLIWAVRNGQYDDMESPAWSVIMDDDRQPMSEAPTSGTSQDQQDTSRATGAQDQNSD